jgi:hypothetical protein
LDIVFPRSEIGKVMRKTLLAILILIAFTANVQAVQVFYTGDQFVEESEPIKTGYIVGIVEAHTFLNASLSQKVFCEPMDASPGQLKAIVMKYLTNHPESRHLTASSLIFSSLQQAFPCK